MGSNNSYHILLTFDGRDETSNYELSRDVSNKKCITEDETVIFPLKNK